MKSGELKDEGLEMILIPLWLSSLTVSMGSSTYYSITLGAGGGEPYLIFFMIGFFNFNYFEFFSYYYSINQSGIGFPDAFIIS